MTKLYGPFGQSYEKEALRLKNLAICKRYISVANEDRFKDRAEYTTDKGSMIMLFSLGRNPRDYEGNRFGLTFKEQAKKFVEEGNCGGSFPEWTLSKATYYICADPEKIFIECDGEGMRHDNSKRYPDIAYYTNHYILRMNFVNDKLDGVVELLNTAEIYRNFPWWQKEPEIY